MWKKKSELKLVYRHSKAVEARALAGVKAILFNKSPSYEYRSRIRKRTKQLTLAKGLSEWQLISFYTFSFPSSRFSHYTSIPIPLSLDSLVEWVKPHSAIQEVLSLTLYYRHMHPMVTFQWWSLPGTQLYPKNNREKSIFIV